MNIKEGIEVKKEISDKLNKFDPDQRLSDIKENIEKNNKKESDDFDPDERMPIEKLEKTEEEPAEKKNFYTTEKERIDKTPREDSEFGKWEGERGNSKFIPSDETESGRKASEKLAEYGQDGVTYKNGEPDFSKCSETTLEIDNMTEHRYNYVDAHGKLKEGNFAQADRKCAALWTKEGRVKEDGINQWTEKDIYKWRHENKYTWHECCDTKTMNLVSREIHDSGKFIHSGGCAECKIRDSQDKGDVFDE